MPAILKLRLDELQQFRRDVDVDQVSRDEDLESNDVLAFPEVAWRGIFGLYRKAMEGTSEAAESVHFSTLWANAAIRLRRRIWVYYGYRHFPHVYIINFGETGDAKTTAVRQGLTLLPEDGPEDGRVKILRGVGSGEALGDWLSQPEDGPKVSHLLFLEELAGLLTRGKWEGSTLLSFLTEAFDCPDLYEIPFRKNPVKLVEPTVSILACTTPE